MTYKTLLRMFAVMAVLLLAFGLYACGGEEAPQQTEPETTAAPTEPHVKSQIFFNVEKLLNQDLVRNKDRVSGLYTFEFFVDGEYVTVQSDSDSLAGTIDRFYASVPEYGKDGNVKDLRSVQSMLGGTFYDRLAVTSVEGNTISVEGTVASITASEDAVIYDMTGLETQIGAPGQVQAGDKLCVYIGQEGTAEVIYIIGRDIPHDDAHECPHCNEAVTWTAWDGTAPLTTGHHLLKGNVTLEQTAVLTEEDVVLCLNGYKLSCMDRVFELTGSAKLSITDHAVFTGVYKGCVEGGGVSVIGLDEKELLGGTVYAENGTQLNLYGGELRSAVTQESARKLYQGGTVYTMGAFNLYDGVLTGGHVTHRGGGLYLGTGGTFHMEGGIIRYGSCGNSGGTACFAKDCEEVDITGGKVIAGVAVNFGGGIFTEKSMVVSGGEFTGDLTDGINAEYGGVFGTGNNGIEVEFLEGVVFYGGSAEEGGNLACRNKCHMILHEGVVLRDGYAVRSGGNVVNFGHLDIEGAKILNGYGVGGGGNLYSYSNGDTVTNFYSGEITGGVGGTGGNVRLSGNPALYEEGSILNFYGGLIADGEATSGNGGNITMTMHSQLHLYGGEIRGGTSAKLGGGICATFNAENNVAPTISVGGSAVVAGNNGSDLYVNSQTVLTFNEEPLTAQAKIGISAYDPAMTFAVGAPEGALDQLFWFDGDRTIVNENGDLTTK